MMVTANVLNRDAQQFLRFKRALLGSSYWRGEFQGPITGTQTCTSIAKGDKTEMVDEIEYTIPGKVLGKIADSLVVEKMQERGLEQTLDNLKLLCEAEVGAIVHA